MFDDLLNSSISDDEFIDESISSKRRDDDIISNLIKTSTPKSLEQACKRLLSNLDEEKCEITDSTDIPLSLTETSEDEIHLSPIIMSFAIFENHIGAAYYNAETSELYILDDIYDLKSNMSILKILYRQCLPKQIISLKGISSAVIKQMQETVAKTRSTATSNNDSSSNNSSASVPNTEFKLLSKTEYSFMSCCSRVKILKLENEPPNMNMSERLLYLNSIINFKSQSMVYALGLLLNYIDKNWNVIDLQNGVPKFLCINHILVKNIVMLNEEAYEALDILCTSQHPSFFKFGNAVAQQEQTVNNLYALYNQCQSKAGSQRLWQTLHYPSKDINLIKMRLDVIEFFMQPNNQFIADNLMSCLKHIQNISPAMLNKTTAQICRPIEWKKFYTTLYHVIMIGEICEKSQQHLQIFENLSKSISEELHFIKYFIEYIIDFDESRRQNKIVIKHGVDVMLDNLTDLRERLPEILTEAVVNDIENMPPEIESSRMLYFPDICFVLCVTKWRQEVDEDTVFPDMELKFTINNLRHYKTKKARELDETIGDIQLKITKRQNQIMTRLVDYIFQHINTFLNALRQCIDLDVLLSFYIVAQNHNYVKPEIREEQIIAIKKSRHPLYELNSPNYVANDIYSDDENGVFKIITGPNACGKSVYLKQVALNVFMAHLGSYIPAESAVIGVVDHILTQISFNESSAFDASAFIQDLRQMNTIIQSATRNSLVIIDEFGKSTTAIDGLAIASTTFANLIERGTECPHVFATTHMHKIINLLPRNNIVQTQTFEYVIHEDNTIIFLYRLIDGNVTSSYAHSVANLCQIESSVLEYSNKVFQKIKNNNIPTVIYAEEEERQYLIRNYLHSLYESTEMLQIDRIKNMLKLIQSKRYAYLATRQNASSE